jgi:hypothetical protein
MSDAALAGNDEAQRKCPWPLKVLLGSYHRASCLGDGSPDLCWSTMIKWLKRDPALKREAAALLMQLDKVNKKRNQGDYLTRVQVDYLTRALSEVDNG